MARTLTALCFAVSHPRHTNPVILTAMPFDGFRMLRSRFLCNLHLFGSALRLVRPLDGSVNVFVLALRNSPYIPNRSGPLLIPNLLQPFRAKLLFPPCRRKVRASSYNTTVRAKLRSSFREKAPRSLSLPLGLSRRSYGSLLCRTAKSPGRPSGTTCQGGFNSSVQLLPVKWLLLASAGAGT